MNTHIKRNIIGDLSALALVAVVLVEGKQNDWCKKFAFELDDVIRRGAITTFGSVLQGLIISSIVE